MENFIFCAVILITLSIKINCNPDHNILEIYDALL